MPEQTIYKMPPEERVREHIRMREKAMHDKASGLAAEREEGIKKPVSF